MKKNYAVEAASREGRRADRWSRGWRKINKISIVEAEHRRLEAARGADYFGAMSNPDEDISPEYGFNYLDTMDEMERPNHWGVRVA